MHREKFTFSTAQFLTLPYGVCFKVGQANEKNQLFQFKFNDQKRLQLKAQSKQKNCCTR